MPKLKKPLCEFCGRRPVRVHWKKIPVCITCYNRALNNGRLMDPNWRLAVRRGRINELLREGKSVLQIARQLKKSCRTIQRDLKELNCA